MEKARGNLCDIINSFKKINTFFNEKTIWQMIYYISISLNEIHSKNYIHNDLKTNNVLFFDNFKLKISDFGRAMKINNRLLLNNLNRLNIYYRPPEIINKNQIVTNKVDIWCLGIIFYYISSFTYPFFGKTDTIIQYCACHSEPLDLPKFYSDELSLFIFKLLNKKDFKRPDIAYIIKYLQDKVYFLFILIGG